jgi:hypothetical protein
MTSGHRLTAKVALGAAAMIVMTFLVHTPVARASTYDASTYDFVGNQISLQITTGSPDNGGFDITKVTGTVLGDPVALAGGNPGPGSAISPDGMFIYDNILYPKSNPVFDWYGLLVQDLAKSPQFLYANIFGDPGTLYFYTSSTTGHYYPMANSNYSGSVAATPLPPTWTMLIAGIIGIGFLSSRRTRKPTFAA